MRVKTQTFGSPVFKVWAAEKEPEKKVEKAQGVLKRIKEELVP